MSRFLSAALAALLALPAAAGEFGLGRPATPDEVAAWNIDVRPDGAGLPDGRGTVAEGEAIFNERCAGCHGDFGEGVGRYPPLAGGEGTLTAARPLKTIGSYWPHLSTVWDYVHRAQPYGDARSLSPDEVYAVVAYLLFLNYVVTDEQFELNRETFAGIDLPNADGFADDDRADSPLAAAHEPCMTACKTSVEITSRAGDLAVTPASE